MTKSTKKRLAMDLEWCLENAETLNFELFAIKFGYINKEQAYRRYKDILNSNSFKSKDSVGHLLNQFDNWKKSTFEASFWNNRALAEKEKQTRAKLQADGYDTAEHFSIKAGTKLRRSRSSDDIPLSFNKHFKNNNLEEKESSQESLAISDFFHDELGCNDEEELDCNNDEDPKSDISINHHPQRKGDYFIIEETDENSDNEESININAITSWVVGNVNLSHECMQYREDCLARRRPKELDDVGLLAINHIYVFIDSFHLSITRHFDCADKHHDIIRSLGIFDHLPSLSLNVYGWCTQCISCTFDNWRELQTLTIGFLQEALKSTNGLDLIVANVLHRILPLLKINGYVDRRGEDSFVHDILAPLLDVIFSFDTNFNHFWANIGINELYKDLKPDYGVYASGLSKRYVVLVAEFKPKEGRQQQENDFIKLGKEMRIMLNEILKIGVEHPAVYGILIRNDKLQTFKMDLVDAKLYVMTQLSSMQLVKSSDDLALVPGLISRLMQLKDLSVETVKKVHTQAKKIKNGKTIVGSSVPSSWLSETFFSLARENVKVESST